MNPDVILEVNNEPKLPPIIKSNQIHPLNTNTESIRNSFTLPNWLVALIIIIELAAICVLIGIYG